MARRLKKRKQLQRNRSTIMAKRRPLEQAELHILYEVAQSGVMACVKVAQSGVMACVKVADIPHYVLLHEMEPIVKTVVRYLRMSGQDTARLGMMLVRTEGQQSLMSGQRTLSAAAFSLMGADMDRFNLSEADSGRLMAARPSDSEVLDEVEAIRAAVERDMRLRLR